MGSASQSQQALLIRLLGGDPTEDHLAFDLNSQITNEGQASYSHQLVHNGVIAQASYRVASVNNDANLDLLVVTADANVHINVEFVGGGDFFLSVYEGVTTSNNGTGLILYNTNRQSTTTYTTTVFHTPTVSDTGTEIRSLYIAGGTGGNSIGGSDGDLARAPEVLLKKNTKYLYRATNKAGSAKAMSFQLGLYEK